MSTPLQWYSRCILQSQPTGLSLFRASVCRTLAECSFFQLLLKPWPIICFQLDWFLEESFLNVRWIAIADWACPPCYSGICVHQHIGLYYPPSGVMVKAMDCEIVVSEFDLQSCYYVHFQTNTLRKGMNPLILPAMGWIVSLLFFLENGFGIK